MAHIVRYSQLCIPCVIPKPKESGERLVVQLSPSHWFQAPEATAGFGVGARRWPARCALPLFEFQGTSPSAATSFRPATCYCCLHCLADIEPIPRAIFPRMATAIGFTLWHFTPPFEGTPTSSIAVTSVGGALTTLRMRLVFRYIFQRTGNIVAPWLAHALMIIGTVAVGAMSFIQYIA